MIDTTKTNCTEDDDDYEYDEYSYITGAISVIKGLKKALGTDDAVVIMGPTAVKVINDICDNIIQQQTVIREELKLKMEGKQNG